MLNKDDLLVYWHLPKCGGTSLTNHIFSELGRNYEASAFLNSYQQTLAEQEGRTYWENLPVQSQKAARFIGGHHATPAAVEHLKAHKKIRFMTILRSPLSRVISTYNYERHQEEQPRDYCESLLLDTIKRTSMCAAYHHLFYSGSPPFWDMDHQQKMGVAEQLIVDFEQFWLIAFQETYEEDIHFLCSKLGIKNPDRNKSALVAGRDFPTWMKETPKLRNTCEQLLMHDYLVYNYFWEKRSNLARPFFTGASYFQENAGTKIAAR